MVGLDSFVWPRYEFALAGIEFSDDF